MHFIVSVILPCRNERESIGKCIQEIKKVARENNIQLEIIISDSSSDGSEKIAEKEKGVKIIKHDTEGYGFAIKEGVKNASGEIIVYGDADGTYQFSDIPKFLAALENADIVLGSRFMGSIEVGAMPLLHRFFGTPFLNLLLLVFFGIKTSDSQSGYRALRKKTFLDLNQKTNGMEFATEMLIKAKKKNLVVKEIPIHYSQRNGVSKLRRYRDGFAHLQYILMQVPILFYILTGTMFFFVGIISVLYGTYIHPFFNSATTKIFFPIFGIQILFFGLFIKTYFISHFHETDIFIKNFYKTFKLSYALILGFLLIGSALVIKITSTNIINFDTMLVFVLLGLQIVFNTTILSVFFIK